MTPVFDSNILIDCLRRHVEAAEELKRYHHRFISVITWIEVMSGAKGSQHEAFVRAFLADNFTIIPLDQAIAERACELRIRHHIKLPDAIILATTQTQNTLLVTRNTKDFPTDHPSVRVPYHLSA